MTLASKTEGRLIAVVGPSGVGKDSVMWGIHGAVPEMHLVQRVITRAPELSGEDYRSVSVATFQNMADSGDFAVHWRAHGLSYGIPSAVANHTRQGTDCLANFSRKALRDAARVFQRLLVLNITAKPETLAKRLKARGRETAQEIAARLAEAEKQIPGGMPVIHLSNDGPLEETVSRALNFLQPLRA
ncbi:MAG: phosphonate metabolism protein/1,5-bisphosphokinase (PRPP-forming) PhnN [Pseudomonadota bacterium]